jgi:hypothetical protein
MGKLKEALLEANAELKWESTNITAIAVIKGHAFSQEYNPTSGRAEDRPNYHALKEGYTAGFLAGFTYKFTGDKDL